MRVMARKFLVSVWLNMVPNPSGGRFPLEELSFIVIKSLLQGKVRLRAVTVVLVSRRCKK